MNRISRRELLKIATAGIVLGLAGTKTAGVINKISAAVITNYDKQAPSAILKEQDGIKPQVGFLTTQDGVALRYARFCSTESPKGTIVLKPGKSGSIEDFQSLANEYAKDGYQVFCADPRGMGLSGRTTANVEKVHVNDFSEYVADDALLIEKVIRPNHGTGPILLVAHSMSGHTAIRAAAQNAYIVDGIVTISPMIEAVKLPTTGIEGKAIHSISRALKFMWNSSSYFIQNGNRDMLTVGTPEQNAYTNNPFGFSKWRDGWLKEKRLITGGVTNGWIDAYYRSCDFLQSLTNDTIKTPTLLCIAQDDSIVSNSAIERLAKKFHTVSIQRINEKHDMEMGNKNTLKQIVGATNDFISELALSPKRDIHNEKSVLRPILAH